MSVTIKFRRDSSTQWTSKNPILSQGEPGFEINTGQIKIGDGVSNWNSLSYLSGSEGTPIVLENIDDRVAELLVAGTGITLNYNDNANILTISASNNAPLPTGSVYLHNGGEQTAQLLQFTNPEYQSVITGPTPAENSNAQRLIIQGQRGTGVYEGGDVYLWGGDSDVNGGDIKIYAGDADNFSPNNGYGGYVNIDGGKGVTSGGNIEITGGYSEGGQAGDVSIVGGPTSSGIAGDVNIKTNNSTNNWVFAPNGRFTLPNGNLIESQAGQGETNIQIIDNESPFKIYTHASVGAKAWIYDADGNLFIPGSISLPNNSTIASGTYDNNMGGNGGISLNCVVGYQLNWQASHLRNTLIGDNTNTPQTIYFDSPITYSPTTISISYSSTINTNATDGEIFDITLTGNATLANPTNPINGKTLRWRITQDGTGNRTVTLGNKFNIPSSASNILPWSTGINSMDILAATYHSGRDKWDIVAFVPGY